MATEIRARAALIFAAAAIAVSAGSAGAQITFDGFMSWQPTSALGAFDASASDKLVVVVTGEHNFNQTANGQIYWVKYDGQLLTRAVDVDPVLMTQGGHGDTATDIWYLDNPGAYHTVGQLTASVSGNGNNYVYTAIGLSGTADGVGATAAAPGSASVQLTTTAANSVVIFNIGMGGSGNTASPLPGVTADSPTDAITFTGLEAGSNWAGHAVARATIGSPSHQTFSFDTTKTDVATIAAEFLPGVPHLLTLRVDPVTGDATIVGDTTRTIAINYYQIISAARSLDSAAWVSLADQDFKGSGPPSGYGDGWEEAGGAGKHALAEAFLLGSSAIGASQSVSLGRGYDADVDARDLAFTYRTEFGKIVEGLVEYVTSALPGDANLDGKVDAADYVALKKSLGTASGAKYRDGDFDLDGGVDWADMAILRANIGLGTAGGTVPEPGMLSLVAMGGLAVLRRRRGPRTCGRKVRPGSQAGV